MTWSVEVTDEFVTWWQTLTVEEQERITVAVERLEERGPSLGRPLVETIKSSKHTNMKELRVGSIRILLAFDPRRVAILLIGGSKARRWEAFYDEIVPKADALLDEHLEETRKEAS